MKVNNAVTYFGWAVVLVSSLGWYLSHGFSLAAEAPVGMPGSGLSLEYHLQVLLAKFLPGFSFALHVFLLPIAAYYFSLKLTSYFLDEFWSTITALLFFSNVSGFPFHIFVVELFSGHVSGYNVPDVKMTDISTVISLAALARLLNPRNLYQTESLSTFLLVASIIFLDSLDAAAITIVFTVFLGLKFYAKPAERKPLIIYLAAILIAWIANIDLATSTDIHTSDLAERGTYIGLYFILPAILFLVGFAALKVDYYQVLRRFGGIMIVFLSELIIVGLHYLEIYKIQLSELQFHSIFPMFHILYFLPPLFWTLNSNFLDSDLKWGRASSLSTIKSNVTGAFIILSLCLLALYNFMAFI